LITFKEKYELIQKDDTTAENTGTIHNTKKNCSTPNFINAKSARILDKSENPNEIMKDNTYWLNDFKERLTPSVIPLKNPATQKASRYPEYSPLNLLSLI
jgi:hypothetical protein